MMREHFGKRRLIYTHAICVVAGLFLGLLPNIRNVRLDPAGGFEFSTREPNDSEVFRAMWTNPDRRTILLSLLGQEGIYPPSDERVVSVIVDLCDPVPSEPIEAYLSAATACAEQRVPNALRELARRRAVPFHPTGRMARIGVPDPADQPARGRVNTCRDGDWFDRQVSLVNSLTERQVTVMATGHYGAGVGCGVIYGTPDFQLNEADALQLFDRPLDKFEEVVAFLTAN